MLYQKNPLPIDAYLNEILKKVENFSTVLIKASPGSGKTTRLPWFLAYHLKKNIAVLEPRRLAAKLAAERISHEEGFKCGEEIGYQFRFEKKLSSKTQVTFYTEGTFLKKALKDRELKDIDIVILDEFHERHLETDMALAFILGLQKKINLKLILMSATLDMEIENQLEDMTSIEIEAPRFPVEITYLPNQPSVLNQTLEQKIKAALKNIPPDSDVLVFLPGMREILKVQSYLMDELGEVFILHSEVSKEEQEEALKEHPRRKIILSTNLTESSITIPGIKAVIDSGIQREAHYSPWNGLKLIVDRPITKSSAIQRSGRAGRTSAGVCHRLYSSQDFESRESFTRPEIQRADLTDIYLLERELNSSLSWITPPPLDRWEKARQLCFLMGFIDNENQLTPLAQSLSSYPVDARISRVLIQGDKLDAENKKQLLAFICRELENDSSGKLEKKLSHFLRSSGEDDSWEKCLLAGFIDQVAIYRSKQNDFIHFSGKTIKLHHSIGPLTSGYYLILNITQKQEAITILPIEEEWLFEHKPFPFCTETTFEVEHEFIQRSQTKLGSIVIDENVVPLKWQTLQHNEKLKVMAMAEAIFLKRWQSWKDKEQFNRFHLWGKASGQPIEEVEQSFNLESYFEFYSEMSWDQLSEYFESTILSFYKNQDLDKELPLTIKLCGNKELKIHYPFNSDPFIEAPIQDFYGISSIPKIGKNKIDLTLKILGPHKRPIQVTKDLAGFWQKTYQEMKKQLEREYPRHYWPDDPAKARAILLKRQL